MANENTICASALMEMMNAMHALGPSPATPRTGSARDSYKAALYFSSATIGRATTVYTATGECTGAGYTATGIAVTNANTPNYTTDTTAFWTPSASFVYTGVTINSAAFNCVLIYNTTQGNKALSSHTFGDQTVTAGTFTLTMPVNDAGTGLIRLTRV